MAEALYKTLAEPTDLDSRMQRRLHAKRFSWQQTARATLGAFADSTSIIARVQAISAK